jgi:PAS domain S-box-containing protein
MHGLCKIGMVKRGWAMKLSEIMSTKLAVLKPSHTIKEASQLFLDRQIDGAPVVNQKGELLGLVTKSHVYRALAQELNPHTPVTALMKKELVLGRPEEQVIGLLDSKVGRLPVVDKNLIIGMITRTDLARAYFNSFTDMASEFAAILDSTHNLIVSTDSNGKISVLNRAAEKFLGLKSSAVRGRDIVEIIPNSGLKEILDTGVSKPVQKIELKQGSFISNRTPIKKGGQIMGAVAVLQDISELESISRALFECIKRDEEHWLKKSIIFQVPDIHGRESEEEPMEVIFSTEGLVMFFKRNFYQYEPVYERAVEEQLYVELKKSVLTPSREFNFKSETWSKLVLALLFEYCFSRELQKDDILNTLTTAFNGRIAAYVMQIQFLEEVLEGIKGLDPKLLVLMEADRIRLEQRKSFLRLRDSFQDKWKNKLLEVTPPLTPSRYLEYVPGIPIVLPNTLTGKGGKKIFTEEVFNRLQRRYQEGFEQVIHQSLGLALDAPASAICSAYQEYLQELEKTMESLFPGDLYSQEGVAQVLQRLFQLLPHQKMFSVRDDTFKEMLLRFPPVNVMIPAGYHSTRELLAGMDIRETVSLANLIETRKYADRALLWILDNLRPEGMEDVDIKYMVLDSRFSQIARLGNISNLNKITTRIVTTPFNKGMGGEFARIRFCLFIARHITIAENYAHLWRSFARERKNLGSKVRNSLIGRYETTAFSAHNIFENLHHRSLVQNFRGLAQRLEEEGKTREAGIIRIMCDSYGLSQVLDDGTFLPLSAWSWASYNYKGGRGVPTPLSSHVEEKWFNHDLLEEIYQELGYDVGSIESGVQQLIGEGRASENVLDTLLGIRPKDVKVVAQEAIAYPPAKPLQRYPGNPILSPIKEHYWESKYVLNAACLRLEGLVYILYRAYGDDQVSRIGLAISDGYRVLERLPHPIFAPANEKESRGCEDPRVVVIDDEIYMMYTAYDGVIAQIAAASIKVEDFLARNFAGWQRKGLAFKDIWNKDAILFPEQIRGKYVIYHRIEPSIWVSYLDKLEFPVPRERHAIIMGPRSGRMWDSLKIGAGTQPIKTRYGWLMIYHGVDRELVYRLGVILVDLNNPELLIYRSPNSILEPEEEYEIGSDNSSWVPNVVFTCGAIPALEKDILEDDDEILVYYGAADTHIAVATATLAELIPAEYRR